MELFEITSVPNHHLGNEIATKSRWYTWSIEFRQFVKEFGSEICTLSPPKLIHLGGNTAYDYTYTLTFPTSLEAVVNDRFQQFCYSLLDIEIKDKPFFFVNLLDNSLSSSLFHRIFALFREKLAGLVTAEIYAMYAPLGATGSNVGAFPLHSDLYPGEVLFNVFDDVSEDNSGSTQLLETATMLELLGSDTRVPSKILTRIKHLLNSNDCDDHFNEFYNLLHGSSNCWTNALNEKMATSANLIHLKFGEGYMLNDRVWLHGRLKPTKGTPKFRLHRLIFSQQNCRI